MEMKGQVTVEYLLLFVVALSLLSLSVFSLAAIRDSSERNFRLLRFRSAAYALAASMREVCALGDGNGREVALSTIISLDSGQAGDGEGYAVRISGGNASIVTACRCKVARSGGLSGTAYVENDHGTIIVKGR